jgi:hypothetical protein
VNPGRFRLPLMRAKKAPREPAAGVIDTHVHSPPDVDAPTGVSAKIIGELRKMTAWPENVAITIPQARDEGVVTVSKASVATRVSPKP